MKRDKYSSLYTFIQINTQFIGIDFPSRKMIFFGITKLGKNAKNVDCNSDND